MNEFSVFDIQKNAGQTLHAAAKRNRLAHAYLFHGLEGTGKWPAAVETAKLIMCADAQKDHDHSCDICRRIADYHHPDVHWILPGSSREKPGNADAAEDAGPTAADSRDQRDIFTAKREDSWAPLEYSRRPYITMSKVRALQYALTHTPVEGPRKIGIIINAENMRADAQAVLLKTIEEPPPDSFIIITTSSRNALLPTILSRCQAVLFPPLPLRLIHDRLVAQLGLPEDAARRAAELSGGGWARARRYAAEEWQVWYDAATALLNAAGSGPETEVALAVDAVFKQRPDLNEILFFFDVWRARLNATLIENSGQDGLQPAHRDSLTAIHNCCAILDRTRAAIIGNVTPRIAVAAGLLEVHRQLSRK